MSDLVPVPEAIRSLPGPAVVSAALKQALIDRVSAERTARGEVHQPEDVYALVRALGGAKDLLDEYGRAFSQAAREAAHNLHEELLSAVGEQDGVPLSGLKVPDLDGTDLVFSLLTPNTHRIDEDAVIDTVIASVLHVTRDTEPDNMPGDDYDTYRERYETWMAMVMRQAITEVIALGSFAMQVSKVRAYQAMLAGHGADDLAAVVRGSVTTTTDYKGVKVERKQRKK